MYFFQVMAIDMSYRLGWIDESIVKRAENILKQAKLPTAPPETMTVEMFKSVMAVRETELFGSEMKYSFCLLILAILGYFQSYNILKISSVTHCEFETAQ